MSSEIHSIDIVSFPNGDKVNYAHKYHQNIKKAWLG